METILKLISKCKSGEDNLKELADAIFDYGVEIVELNKTVFDEEVVDVLSALILLPQYTHSQDASRVLSEIQFCFSQGQITVEQTAKICRALIWTYALINNDSAEEGGNAGQCITRLEFFIERIYPDESLMVLNKLQEKCSGTPLYLLPYGYYYLFKNFNDMDIREQCLAALTELSKSTDESLAYEASLHYKMARKWPEYVLVSGNHGYLYYVR